MTRDAAEEIYNAATKEHITEYIAQLEDDDSRTTGWEALGRNENNASIVDNQTGNGVMGLAELMTNCFDSILLKNYKQKGGDYDSLQEAADSLIDESEEEVILRTDGKKSEQTHFTVIDSGEGQSQDDFEGTFLGLTKPGLRKQAYDFLQGKYGMGSSASIHFAGEDGTYGNYKFICSAAYDDPEAWSWSIIRQNRNRAHYEYLKIDGDVPTFSGTFEGKSYGSVIKTFDYRTNHEPIQRTGGNYGTFRRELERVLFDIPSGVRLVENRDDVQNSTSTVNGHASFLEQEEQKDDSESLLRKKLTLNINFEESEFGRKDVDVYVLKDKDTVKENDNLSTMRLNFLRDDSYAVLYTVNGQTHGREPKYFVKGRCNLSKLEKSLIVRVDFSDITGMDMSNVFQPTRDRLKDRAEPNQMVDKLSEKIQSHDFLRGENSRRLRSTSTDIEDEQSIDAAVEERLDSTYDNVLTGKRIANDTGTETPPTPTTECEIAYEDHPNEFGVPVSGVPSCEERTNKTVELWAHNNDGHYQKDVDTEENYTQVNFWGDMPEDYLEDQDDDSATGVLDISVTNADPDEIDGDIYSSSSITNGLLSLDVNLEGITEPRELEYEVSLIPRKEGDSWQQSLRQSFDTEFSVSLEASADDTDDGTRQRPELHLLGEQEVEARTDMDEFSIVNCEVGAESSIELIEVNIDAQQYNDFVERNELDDEELRNRYVTAVYFLTIQSYNEFETRLDESPNEILLNEVEVLTTDLIEHNLRGVGDVLLEEMVSEEEIERWS